jgi:uncharacterized protein (DUF1697 family)
LGTYISMLRGVNVGKNQMRMEELRLLYESLGFGDVRSYVQSGNVVFEHDDTDISKLRELIERSISKHFGFEAPVFVRTRDELRTVVENNPLTGKDETKLHVIFLSNAPANFPLDELARAKDKAEDFACSGAEVYLFCPNSYGQTKLSNAFFERKLGVAATTRNWRTVNALLSMAEK